MSSSISLECNTDGVWIEAILQTSGCMLHCLHSGRDLLQLAGFGDALHGNAAQHGIAQSVARHDMT